MYGLIQKHKRLAAIIIAVASLSFLFWMFSVSDIKQMFGLQRCAAAVNDYCISLREFNHELRKYQSLLEKEELRTLVKRQVLFSLINRELLYQKALDVGVVASDREVAELIKRDPQFQEGGKFSFKLYAETLERAGLTPVEYEGYLKKSLTIRKLIGFIKSGTYLSPKELEFQKKILSARFSGRAYLLNASSVKLDYKPTLEELKEFYSRNAEKFSLPSVKRFRVWETADKGKAQSIYRELKRGKVPEGGNLFKEEELPSALKDTVRNLKVTEPFTLTKVKGKYYVIYLEESSPGRVKSFEEARKDIEKLLVEEKKAELVEKKARELRELLSKGARVDHKHVRFDNSTVEEFITLFKIQGDEVLRLVFSEDRVFGPYRTAGGYAVVYIEKRSFDSKNIKNRGQLEDSLLNAKLDSLVNLFAERLAEEADIQINEEYLK